MIKKLIGLVRGIKSLTKSKGSTILMAVVIIVVIAIVVVAVVAWVKVLGLVATNFEHAYDAADPNMRLYVFGVLLMWFTYMLFFRREEKPAPAPVVNNQIVPGNVSRTLKVRKREQYLLGIIGSGFDATTRVYLDGEPHRTIPISPEAIGVYLDAEELERNGVLILHVGSNKAKDRCRGCGKELSLSNPHVCFQPDPPTR